MGDRKVYKRDEISERYASKEPEEMRKYFKAAGLLSEFHGIFAVLCRKKKAIYKKRREPLQNECSTRR